MSVIKFEMSLFKKVAGTVLYTHPLNMCLTSIFQEDYNSHVAIWHKSPTNEKLKNFVGCWADRLFIANQIAYAYTYNEALTLERMGDISVHGFEDMREFLSKLKSIKYNVWTNGGNSFLNRKDYEILEALIAYVSELVIEKHHASTLEVRFIKR